MIKYLVIVIALVASVSNALANDGGIRLKDMLSQEAVLEKIVNEEKYTLVMVWATDCPICEKQKPMIQAFQNDFADTRATVIGIANDGQAKINDINNLIDKHQPTYPNYVASPETFFSDFERVTGQEFRGTPTYILYDQEGVLMGVAVGPIDRDRLYNIVSN